MTLKRISHWIAPVVIATLFGSFLIGQDRLAFRDVSHFYTPLYDYAAERTADNWLPLWNPLDQTGMPLVGETTTAVFYPVRYALFSLPLENAIAWYVVLHLILASFAATWAARRAGVSDACAAVAGICYPLCGSVLFLYSNPPFLVGAAWLPFVLGALVAKRSMTLRSRYSIGGFSLAMMILAGDPQTALHGVMVSSAVWLCRLRKPDIEFPTKQAAVAIALSALIAAALSAPQIAASVSWSRQSERIHAVKSGAWYLPPQTESVRGEAYQFSLPPWHVAELLTPNASGNAFPINRRLSRLVPGESRMWTPSIYMSMLAFVALIVSISHWRQRGADAWSAIAVVSLLLSFGHFGLVWLMQQIPGVLGNVDSAIGGAYWWLYQFFPGYSSFRYPAKWLPVFSLAVAIVTARFLQQRMDVLQESNSNREFNAVALVIAIGIVVAYTGIVFMRHKIQANASLVDEYWGPMDASGGISQIRWSLLHSVLSLAAILLVIRWATRFKNARGAVFVLLLIVAVDLGIGMRGLIASTNAQNEAAVVEQIKATRATSDDTFVFRTIRNGGWPKQWKQSNSQQRMDEVALAERIAWFGRWHLHDRVAVLNNMTSIRSQSTELFWKSANEIASELSAGEQRKFWLSICHWLRVTDVLSITSQPMNSNSSFGDLVLPNVQLKPLQNEDDVSAFSLHADWQEVDSSSMETRQVKLMLRQIYESGDDRQLIVQKPDSDTALKPGFLLDRSVTFSTNIDTAKDALFVRRVFQDGHWTAVATNRESQERRILAVWKVDLLKQGVIVPAGKWNLQFYYSPRWLAPSLMIAVLAWGFCLLSLLQTIRLRWRDRLAAPDPTDSVLSQDLQEH